MRKVLAIAGAILLACSDNGPGVDPAVGVFVLQTVNGSPLPFNGGIVSGIGVEIVGDQYTFAVDGTYSRQGSLRLTQLGITTTQAITETGTWVRNGTVVTLTIITSNVLATGTYSGELNGNNLTLIESGFVGLYRRS